MVILENLIENSINFCSSDEPFIHISSKVSEENVQLMVEDNGVGIDPEYYAFIFDMYYRANLTSTGNGLGLYIAKKAVEKLGGTITFNSEVNKGSTFYVNLGVHEY